MKKKDKAENLRLKIASLQKDQLHYLSARNLNLRPDIFSGFLSGRLTPKEEQIKKFENYFNKTRVELGL